MIGSCIGQPHKEALGITMVGQGGPRDFFRKWGNPCKMIFWEGLGGNGPAQRLPGSHTIHSPRTDPLKPHGEPLPPQNHVFSEVIFSPKRSPAQPEPSRIQMWNPGVQKRVPGSKVSNFRFENTFRTEPYVASYGRKPFWATWLSWLGDLICGQSEVFSGAKPAPR